MALAHILDASLPTSSLALAHIRDATLIYQPAANIYIYIYFESEGKAPFDL